MVLTYNTFMSPELEPTEPKEKSLVIRGHHLKNLQDILTEGKVSVGNIEKIVSRETSKLLYSIKFYHDLSEDFNQYKEDVLGTTSEEEVNFVIGFQGFLRKILTFPDDYSVTIVTDKRDDICKLCTIGNHCSQPMYKGDEDTIHKFFGKDSSNEFTTNLGELRELFKNLPKPFLLQNTSSTFFINRV